MFHAASSSSHRATLLAVAWSINSLAYSIVYPFLLIYLHNVRGLPMAQVGLIFPLMAIGTMIGPPLSGLIVDRFGRRRLLFGSSAGRGVIFLMLTLAAIGQGPFWAFALLLALSSMLGTFFQIAADAYLADLTEPAERPRAYSKIRVGTNIGWTLGPALGAFLSAAPFSLLFGLTGVLCLGCAGFVYRNCPETHHRTAAASGTTGHFSFFRMLTHREFMIVIGLNFLLMLLVTQLFTTLSVYATQHVKISQGWLGIIYSANGLTIVVSQLFLTRVLDRFRVDLHLRMCLGAIMYVIGYFFMAFIATPGQMMLLVATLTIGEVIVQPALYSLVSRLAPPEGRGRYMGMLGLIRGLGFALGPYFGALLFARWAGQPLLLWSVLSGFGLLAAIGFAWTWRAQPHRYRS